MGGKNQMLSSKVIRSFLDRYNAIPKGYEVVMIVDIDELKIHVRGPTGFASENISMESELYQQNPFGTRVLEVFLRVLDKAGYSSQISKSIELGYN